MSRLHVPVNQSDRLILPEINQSPMNRMPKIYRSHFSIILANAAKWYSVLFFILLAQLENIVTGLIRADQGQPVDLLVVIGVALGSIGLLLVLLGISYLQWKKTRLILDQDDLILEKKFLYSKKFTVPIHSIATINLQQNLFMRVFSLYRVKIDIHSAALADKPDFSLMFKEDIAQEIKAYLEEKIIGIQTENRLPGTSAASDSAGDAKMSVHAPDLEITFSIPDLVLHALVHQGFLVRLVSIIASLTVGLITLLTLFMETRQQELLLQKLYAALPLQQWPVLLAILLLAATAMIVVLILISAVWNALTYHDFRIKRSASHLSVTYGLFNRKTYSMPVSHVSAIILKQTLLERITHRYALEAANVGMGDEEKEVSLLCLSLPRARLLTVLAQVLPEYAFDWSLPTPTPLRLIPLLTMAMIAWVVPLLLLSALTTPWIVLPALLALPYTWLLHRSRSFDVKGSCLIIRSGLLSRRHIFVFIDRIQQLSVKSNPICRALHLGQGDIIITAPLRYKHFNTGIAQHAWFDHLIAEMSRTARQEINGIRLT